MQKDFNIVRNVSGSHWVAMLNMNYTYLKSISTIGNYIFVA